MTPEQLKNSILQLAIQGKLVEQRKEEGTGEELFKEIKKEEEKLITEGKLKKEKALLEISEEEIPFDIPKNWKWVRFGELGRYKKGPFGSDLTKDKFVPKGDKTIKVYEQKNAIKKDASLGEYYITKDYFLNKLSGFSVEPGDIIVSCAGTIGETFIMPDNIEKGIINQALMRMKLFESIYVEYFLLYFDYVLKKNAKENSKGSAIKNIPPFAILKNYLVPLPPLAEQKRIVEKIEELLPLVEKYEKAWTRLEELNKKFPLDMKKSILEEAIKGKLVEQRKEEGTGEELFKEIQEEKKRLIDEGKLKKQKALPEITEEEIPFDIPENWKWVRLGEISTYSQSKTKIKISDIDTPMWSLDLEDIEKESGKIISRITTKNRKFSGEKTIFNNGQILYSKLRPYLKKILVAPDNGVCSSEIVPFDMIGNCDSRYIVYVLKSAYVDFFINSVTYGVKMPRVGTETMTKLLIPLPPLAEQKRIVEKIEEFLPLCEKLK